MIQFRGTGLTRDQLQLDPLQQVQAPTTPAILFGHAPADSVHFSGRRPAAKEKPVYEILPATASDPYSLRDMLGDADITESVFGNDGIGKMAAQFQASGMEEVLRQHRSQPHHMADQSGYRSKYEAGTELYQLLGGNGFLGITVPEQYTGGRFDSSLITVKLGEMLGQMDLGTATNILASRGLFGDPILEVGTEEQKLKYIPGILSGEAIGAFGLTEPNIGSDPGSVKTTATAFVDSDGKRKWKLNGTKTFITNGNIADYYVIVAKTTDENGNSRKLSGFVVHADDAGFSTSDVAGKDSDGKLGLHTSDTATLNLDDVVLDDSRIIGGEEGLGQGRRIYDDTLTGGRIGVGAMGVGVAQAALDMEIQYAKERAQGKYKEPGTDGAPKDLPIKNYIELREIIARDAIDVEVPRTLAYHAARVKDAGEPFKKLASMTKLFASEMAAKHVTDDNIQVHGGMGFMEETGAGKLWRDARVLRIYEGTSQIQKMIIVGEILGDPAMQDLKANAKPQKKGDHPKNVYEAIDWGLGAAMRHSEAPGIKAFDKYGHMMTVANAIQGYGYRTALIATYREGLRALKGHVERLKEAGIPSAKEEAMLRVFAFETLDKTKTLLAEMGVPKSDNPARFPAVMDMLLAPETTVMDDLEVVAQDLLGDSVYTKQ